jgi:predicted lipoprotein with Yx(FWY)xxD motif
MRRLALTAFAGVLLLSAQTSGYAQGATMPDNVKVSGGMLTNAKGMTLYTFDRDMEPGKSACYGQCSSNWPALVAAANAKAMGDWRLIARDNGSKQWAYKGKPLYTFNRNAKPGDMTGDGFGNVWHTAAP